MAAADQDCPVERDRRIVQQNYEHAPDGAQHAGRDFQNRDANQEREQFFPPVGSSRNVLSAIQNFRDGRRFYPPPDCRNRIARKAAAKICIR